ncbi:hypothetical protein AMAG_09554 [Allomyces macrogynus ATCC 38327]|uniref:Uncharacterized protein n=1 Tax=Allomyces macrogynus (strain ATCC 38327) TaxID=578462 RepID=A0A0L0SSN6_ALLM3|nr:hypothetical protein AMAG_09554 [Allomyces macrogynus ATCC 38327]|eukprot:KNE65573.1 hypothetical protein AMAG_09554 [Allomyces macrogynus ATCC 38327]
MLAHAYLLSVFTYELRDADNEAKDLAFLSAAETRYLAYMDALAKAVAKDAPLAENLPLPPADVAMFWHSHMLSPNRYADDMGRRYGLRMLAKVSFPMIRLAKAHMGAAAEDVEAFWMANLPANMPYEHTLASADETTATGTVKCASCFAEQSLAMPEYAAFRLHKGAHTCTECKTEFTSEQMAVRRFLARVARVKAPAMLAGTLTHPKTHVFVGLQNPANLRDLDVLFDKAAWAKLGAALPALPTWADVGEHIFKPILEARADKLLLPGNRMRLMRVLKAHEDVVLGPWSMDMVRAVRRQGRFAAQMAALASNNGMCAVHAFHTEALVQYPKFLAAMVAAPTAMFVPTLPIDLAWHTHQLSEAKIEQGAKDMLALWRALFDEDYHAPNLAAAIASSAKCIGSCGYQARLDGGRCMGFCSDFHHPWNPRQAKDGAAAGQARLDGGKCMGFCSDFHHPWNPRQAKDGAAAGQARLDGGKCMGFCSDFHHPWNPRQAKDGAAAGQARLDGGKCMGFCSDFHHPWNPRQAKDGAAAGQARLDGGKCMGFCCDFDHPWNPRQARLDGGKCMGFCCDFDHPWNPRQA